MKHPDLTYFIGLDSVIRGKACDFCWSIIPNGSKRRTTLADRCMLRYDRDITCKNSENAFLYPTTFIYLSGKISYQPKYFQCIEGLADEILKKAKELQLDERTVSILNESSKDGYRLYVNHLYLKEWQKWIEKFTKSVYEAFNPHMIQSLNPSERGKMQEEFKGILQQMSNEGDDSGIAFNINGPSKKRKVTSEEKDVEVNVLGSSTGSRTSHFHGSSITQPGKGKIETVRLETMPDKIDWPRRPGKDGLIDWKSAFRVKPESNTHVFLEPERFYIRHCYSDRQELLEEKDIDSIDKDCKGKKIEIWEPEDNDKEGSANIKVDPPYYLWCKPFPQKIDMQEYPWQRALCPRDEDGKEQDWETFLAGKATLKNVLGRDGVKTLLCRRIHQCDMRLLVYEMPVGMYTISLIIQAFDPLEDYKAYKEYMRKKFLNYQNLIRDQSDQTQTYENFQNSFQYTGLSADEYLNLYSYSDDPSREYYRLNNPLQYQIVEDQIQLPSDPIGLSVSIGYPHMKKTSKELITEGLSPEARNNLKGETIYKTLFEATPSISRNNDLGAAIKLKDDTEDTKWSDLVNKGWRIVQGWTSVYIEPENSYSSAAAVRTVLITIHLSQSPKQGFGNFRFGGILLEKQKA